MQEQNYKNHTRYIPAWHMVTTLLICGLLGGSIFNLMNTAPSNHYSAALIVLVAIIFVLVFWYARWFALRAQDRAIRAEENFRCYILTGKPLNPSLRLGQIIALRFASDAEYAALSERAVKENLSQKQIKEAIQNWKGDYHRV